VLVPTFAEARSQLFVAGLTKKVGVALGVVAKMRLRMHLVLLSLPGRRTAGNLPYCDEDLTS
jgi:hypothetical protein